MSYDDEYDLAPEPAAPPKRQTRTAAAAAATQAGRAPTTASSMTGAFARGNLIVVKSGAVLPDRCVKCNAPALDGKRTKHFAYDEPDNKNAVLALMPVIGVFFKFVWLIGKLSRGVERITVTYCVCRKHRQTKILALASIAVLVPLGLILLVNGIAATSGAIAMAGAALLFAGAIAGAMGLPTLSVVSCHHKGAELKGAGKPFLDSLPKPGAYRPPAY